MTTPDLAAAEDFHWALIGPGRIAGRFAEAVGRLPGMRLSHVLGRDAQRARDFAARWPDAQGRLPQAGSDLAAALADPSIHGVYVATPHAQHGEAVRAALAAGKAVLCEKPLVPNRAQGEALVALARERGAFLMEAVWTRFLPIYDTVGQWLREGAIGELRAVQSSFCFPATYDPAGRLFNPALAGGALLDIGIYNLSISRWVLQQALGHCPEYEQLQVSGLLAPTGVDQRLNVGLQLPGGLSVQFFCALDACADNALRIYGSVGYIELPQRFWQATEARLQRRDEPEQRVQRPLAINGFEGEILEAVRCVRAGLLESPQISHAESLATLAWMDSIRARLGLRYPFEA